MSAVFFDRQGSGKDVVLIHGWGLHGGIFSSLAKKLSSDYQITTVDLPGHGRSAGLDLFDIEKTADTLVALVDRPAIWLGWSLGALLAMTIAIRHPQAVAALVLVSATPRFINSETWPHAMAPETLQGFAADLADNYKSTLDRFLSLQTGKEKNSRDLVRRLRDQVLQHGAPNPVALAAGLDILRTTDLRPQLASIEQPALVVNGGRDRLTPPAAGEYLATHLADGQYILFRDAGHAAFLSHEQAFIASVKEFLHEPR